MISMSFTRRQILSTFVISAGALAASSLVGCSAKKKSNHSSTHFPQSVMTGDPTSDSIVFWTRVEAAEETRRAKLHLWKANPKDARETPVVTTSSTQDGIVKLKLVDLEPNTDYQYQFEYLSETGDSIAKSVIGVTKTAPNVTADQPVRFAFASCQDFNGRYFNPYLTILNDTERFDFLVHLGDYIYETTGDPNFQLTAPGERKIHFDDKDGAITLYAKNGDRDPLAFQAARSLDNYRQLYREYRKDPILQQVHERMAMIAIWDDHEFSDDSYGANATYYDGIKDEADPERKRHAEQAYFEYMPIDRAPYINIKGAEQSSVALNAETDLFPNTKAYRSFQFGKHLSIFLADTRSFRKDHLIPENTLFTRSAISSQNISDIEDGLIQLASKAQVDALQSLLPSSVYQRLKMLEKGMQAMPLSEGTRPAYKDALHQQMLVLLKADAAINPINNLLHNAQLILGKTLQANANALSHLTADALNALSQALITQAEAEPSARPPLNNTKPAPLSTNESKALKLALKGTIETTLTLIKEDLKAGTDYSKNAALIITKRAEQALLSTLQTNAFYEPLLTRVLLLSEFSLKPGQKNSLLLADNQLETLYDVLTSIASEKSPTTLLDKATDYPEMKQRIISDLENEQSLGVIISSVDQYIAAAKQKGIEPNNAIDLLNSLKTKVPDLILARAPDSQFKFIKDTVISVPFAALAHLTPFSDIGSRYLVAKDRFDLYALVKMFTSKPLEALLQEIAGIQQNPTAALTSMLGEQQTQQLAGFLFKQQSTWKVLGSSISTTPLVADMRSETERKAYAEIDPNNKSLDKVLAAIPDLYKQRFYINVDQWDGYPIEKGVLQKLLANTNTIAIAGDIHSAYASTFQSGDKILVELTTPTISSLEVGGMLDKGLDNLLRGTPVEGKAGPIKAKYKEMLMNAPKVAAAGDGLQRSNIQLAETRVQGIAVVEVNQDAMTVEYRMLDANHDKLLGYTPTQSFYHQKEALLKLVRKSTFKVTRNEQGNNVLEAI
jgi:phosphodiesterase/alkaline phosphatase D-like protein